MIGIKEKKKSGPKPGFNSKKAQERLSKQVLRGHYEWCKKEGRDISWYKEHE